MRIQSYPVRTHVRTGNKQCTEAFDQPIRATHQLAATRRGFTQAVTGA